MDTDFTVDPKTKEYELLHQQTSDWQKRQINLLTLGVAAIPTVLALGEKIYSRIAWPVVSLALLVVLFGLLALAKCCVQERFKIKAYLQVFHENESAGFFWETRNSKYAEATHSRFEVQAGYFCGMLRLISIAIPPIIYSVFHIN